MVPTKRKLHLLDSAQSTSPEPTKTPRTHGWPDNKTPPPAANTRGRSRMTRGEIMQTRASKAKPVNKVDTRASTAKPFSSLQDIASMMCAKSKGGMLAADMTSFDQDAYYHIFKASGANKLLRRFQATELTVLRAMKTDLHWNVCLATLSEYGFGGFRVLQANCRTIIHPVGDGSRVDGVFEAHLS